MTSDAVRAAADQVHAAWTNAGPVPAEHIRAQFQLLAEWPTLFHAVNNLVTVLDLEPRQ